MQEQLQPHLLQQSCERAGHPLQLDMEPGYDHSYYFVSSFIESHLDYHLNALK